MEENNRTFEFAARFASEKEIVRFIRFLDPAQAVEAERIARQHGVNFSLWGGYDSAERAIGCFAPRNKDVERSEFPLVSLHSRYSSKFSSGYARRIYGFGLDKGQYWRYYHS